MAETQHITLRELQRRVKAALEGQFALPVWVSAEISEIKVNYSGHCYLELIEKGGDNGVPTAQARAVVWRSHYPRISGYFEAETGQRLAAGIKILAKVLVSYHELYGFSLQITDIDPSYTLGDMERQRQQTIAQLQQDGVWEMNREVLSRYDTMTVGETSSATVESAADYANLDGSELSMIFQFQHVSVDEAPKYKWCTDPLHLPKLKCVFDKWETGLYGKAWNSLYWNNHDQPRIASFVRDERALVNYTAMLYFLKGTTLLYAGQEFENDHLPSLFDLDPIDRRTGRDLSGLLRRLYAVKQQFGSADWFFADADDVNDLALLQRGSAGKRFVGVFSLKAKAADVRVDAADGVYENLIERSAVTVKNGILSCTGEPVILRAEG